MREIKTLEQEVVKVEDRTVTGICAVFGNVDLGGDRIMSGAFTKTLQEGSKRWRHLWNHGIEGWDYFSTPPIAKVESIREVGRNELGDKVLAAAAAATGGLEVTRTYLETERGEEVLQALKAGVPLEMSFGYDVIQVKYIEKGEELEAGHWRDLQEVRLYDTTDCNYGMNSATSGLKSGDVAEQLALVEARLKPLLNKMRAGMSERALLELAKLKALILEVSELADEEDRESRRAELRASDFLGSLTEFDAKLLELESFVR